MSVGENENLLTALFLHPCGNTREFSVATGQITTSFRDWEQCWCLWFCSSESPVSSAGFCAQRLPGSTKALMLQGADPYSLWGRICFVIFQIVGGIRLVESVEWVFLRQTQSASQQGYPFHLRISLSLSRFWYQSEKTCGFLKGSCD